MTLDLFDIPTSPTESLTLLDLQRMVRTTLEDRFDVPLWISAEVSELKLNRSGHCYLNLVEKGASDGSPRAEARAVIWRSSYASLASKFEQATNAKLHAGIRILVRVIVTYHEVYGFTLQIIDLDPCYTLGEVERRRRETISRLQSDGVWDMNRELALPRLVQRIAIISSATAAGYRDFMSELGRAPYRFTTTLFESLMQGDVAEDSVVSALGAVALREEEFDVVVIIRGGGSTSDLALFDSYNIASHVAQFPLPVISGIGHDKDVSVVDMVASTACKTPTAVATHLVELADSEAWALDNLARQLRDGVVERLSRERLNVERFTAEVMRAATVSINGGRMRLDNLSEKLANESRKMVEREEERLRSAMAVVESHSPDNILRLGFALMRINGAIVNSVDSVNCGDEFSVELADGIVNAQINSKIKKK